MQYLYTLTKADVGKTRLKIARKCSECGHVTKHTISVFDVLGQILPEDAGRKLYLSKRGVVYVEFKGRR